MSSSVPELAIEASAGTGKTYRLTTEVVRAIATGQVECREILLVTFTRAATEEMRHRLRQRLREVAAAVRLELDRDAVNHANTRADQRHAAGSAHDDEVRRLLGVDSPGALQASLDRLNRAIVAFDQLTITTLHGFAYQALVAAGALEGDASLRSDLTQLTTEVATDVLVTEAATPLAHTKLTTLVNWLAQQRSRPGAELYPTRDELNSVDLTRLTKNQADSLTAAWQSSELLSRTQRTLEERRRRLEVRSFDDLLGELNRLCEENPATAREISARYGLVLIDEFQDTDAQQWRVFTQLFEHVPLVVVGDPKQSIYRFRGADLATYQSAVSTAGQRESLSRNWRSDAPLLTALGALFRDVDFAMTGSTLRAEPVEASPEHNHGRLTGPDGQPLVPLSIRLMARDRDGTDIDGKTPVARSAAAVDDDVVSEVGRLLSVTTIDGDPPRRLRPSDIALLVTTGAEANRLQRRLRAVGIPAVLTRGASVLDSLAADHLRVLLAALAEPSNPGRVRAVGLSWFGGMTAAELDVTAGDQTVTDDRLATIESRLVEWNDALRRRGAVAFLRLVRQSVGVDDVPTMARIAATDAGDRHLTDFTHLLELLGSLAEDSRIRSATGLQRLLDVEPDDEVALLAEVDPTARRMESDQDAVQIMTIWVSKGLEFPVVLVPSLWRLAVQRDGMFHLHGRERFNPRAAPAIDGHWATDLSQKEIRAEQARLAYVALTRAKHHAVVWWVPERADTFAAVLAPDPNNGVNRHAVGKLSVDDVRGRLAETVARSNGTIAVTEVDAATLAPPTEWADPESTASPVTAAEFSRTLERHRARHSFSALTADESWARPAEEQPLESQGGVGDEPPQDAAHDGVEIDGAPPAADTGLGNGSELPQGTQFGVLVHEVLERVDFAAPTLTDDLLELTTSIAAAQQFALDPVAVSGALSAAITTPLGPIADNRALRDFEPQHRLNELEFDLRLGEQRHPALASDLGRILADHLEASPLRDWALDWADSATDRTLAGHLTGSIDAVLRWNAAGTEQFLVVDYKTNRLRGPDAYGRDGLLNAMALHHYPLQAALYQVALYRFLRWRLGREPLEHMAGAAYLFLRGMVGPDTPRHENQPAGVFAWRFPDEAIRALSSRLDGQP
jgi:exodeoxyribonuclease V beta subunit